MNSKMEKEALRLWLLFLASSTDYQDYCTAVQSGDGDAQQKLLRQHPAIGLVYSDFGDMSETTPYHGGKLFADWYKQRKELFETPYGVREVLDPSTVKFEFTSALLQVQLTEDYEKVKEDVAAAMDRIYRSRFHALLWGAMPKRARPKYELYRGDGTINAATVRAIKKNFYVGALKFVLEAETGKKVSQTTLVYECKKDKKNPFEWVLTADEENAVAKEGAAQVYMDCSELTTVKRCLKQFNACMKNALNGRFPVNS
jgi:hypothetical protein